MKKAPKAVLRLGATCIYIFLKIFETIISNNILTQNNDFQIVFTLILNTIQCLFKVSKKDLFDNFFIEE